MALPQIVSCPGFRASTNGINAKSGMRLEGQLRLEYAHSFKFPATELSN